MTPRDVRNEKQNDQLETGDRDGSDQLPLDDYDDGGVHDHSPSQMGSPELRRSTIVRQPLLDIL